MKLYMVMLGATPKGRFTEQHDIFFGIADSLKDLIPDLKAFWPDTKIHIDAWREVTNVENHTVKIIPKALSGGQRDKLFFINLGGYKENEFEEFHYKVLTIGNSMADAAKKAKATAFYKHYRYKGAESHIDDKFGIDIDDIYTIEDILPKKFSSDYSISLLKNELPTPMDILHIGYLQIEKLQTQG